MLEAFVHDPLINWRLVHHPSATASAPTSGSSGGGSRSGGARGLASVPWESRPHLLFFSGHVPKVNINPTRYLIWRQVRNLRGVVTASHTLNCSVGSYLHLCFGGGFAEGNRVGEAAAEA